MFKPIANLFHRSVAAAHVEVQLEAVENALLLSTDAALFANDLVEAAWDSPLRPMLDGAAGGKRPSKAAFAAVALANGLRAMAAQDPDRRAVGLALGRVLGQFERGERTVESATDATLLEIARERFAAFQAEQAAPARSA